MASGKDKLRGRSKSGGGPPLSISQMMESMTGDIAPRTEIPGNAIVVEDGVYRFRDFIFTRQGFEVPEDISGEDWMAVFQIIAGLDDAVQWAIGDLIVHAELVWGQSYADLAQLTGYQEQTLRTYAYVAGSVNLLTRVNKLSFSHHRIVASLRDDEGNVLADEQRHWLEQAAENGWSRDELKAAISAAKREKQLPAQTQVTDDSFLFDKKRKPNLNHLQKQWSAARSGDEEAREKLRSEIESTQAWLQELWQSLED